MKMKDSTLYRFVSKEDNATLSKVALNDKRIGPTTLGFLLYASNCEYDPDNFEIEIVHGRFGMSRDWWNDHFNKLKEIGYAKRKKKNIKGVFTHIFLIADDPELIADPNIFDTIDFTSGKSSRLVIPKRHQEIPQRDFTPSPKPHVTKFLDPNKHTQEELELAQFFMEYGFALPQKPREWQEAKKAGIRAWIEITETALDWVAARIVNSHLKEPIRHDLLDIAFEKWTGRGYKKTNADGILEWYEQLCKDSSAEPWKRQRSKQNAKYNNSRRQSRKEHGTSNVEYSEADYETIE